MRVMNLWRPQTDKAYTYAQKALEINPNDSLAWLVLGACYRAFGLPEKALEAYRRAGRADPLYVLPPANAAVTLVMLGRFEEAWRGNEQAAALEGDNWAVLLNRILIRYPQRRLDEAEQRVEEARKRLPASEQPLVDVFAAW